MFADGCGEIFQFIEIARVAGGLRWIASTNLCDAALPAGRFLTGWNEGIESFAESGTWGHE